MEWHVASMVAAIATLQDILSLHLSAMYAGELWGVHPRSGAQCRMTAQKHSKFLRQLIRVSPSTETTCLLAELGHLSLQQRWLQTCIRFWNALVALPMDDLFRDVLYDSLQDRQCRAMLVL